MGPLLAEKKRRDSKSLKCWQVAAPGDSPVGCRKGSAACQHFVRPERHAQRDAEGIPTTGHPPPPTGTLVKRGERDSKSLRCWQVGPAGSSPVDTWRHQGRASSDSGLRPSPLRGRYRLRRCGPILPPLCFGRMVVRPERHAQRDGKGIPISRQLPPAGGHHGGPRAAIRLTRTTPVRVLKLIFLPCRPPTWWATVEIRCLSRRSTATSMFRSPICIKPEVP